MKSSEQRVASSEHFVFGCEHAGLDRDFLRREELAGLSGISTHYPLLATRYSGPAHYSLPATRYSGQ